MANTPAGEVPDGEDSPAEHGSLTDKTIKDQQDEDRAVEGAGAELSLDRPNRSRTLTDKGRKYGHDQAVNAFKNSVKSLKCKNTQCMTLLSNIEAVDILQLHSNRDNLETAANELSDCYHNLGTWDRTLLIDFRSVFDECSTRNASTMFSLTQAIRALENSSQLKHDSNSHKSRKSKSSHHSRSGGSSRSNRSSRHSGSSTASMKAAAAAKAAELRARLKYHDTENEQQAQLAKTRLLRDLEVEEAKFAAISKVEGGSLPGNDVNDVYVNQAMPSVLSQLQSVVSRAAPVNNVSNVSEPVISQTEMLSNNNVVTVSSVQIAENANVLNSNAPEFIPKGRAIQNSSNILDLQPSSNPKIVKEQTSSVAPNSSNSFVSDVASGLNNLVGSLNDFVTLSRVPVPEPGTFEGNPIEYPCWRSALRLLIERKNIPPSDYIHYLKGCIGGAAKRCVAGFLQIPTEESFNEAISLIDKRFGNPFVIAQSFKAKLQEWPKIAARDHVGLQEFSDFLCQCEVAARSNESLRVLDDDLYNNELVLKLPDWLSDKWARDRGSQDSWTLQQFSQIY